MTAGKEIRGTQFEFNPKKKKLSLARKQDMISIECLKTAVTSAASNGEKKKRKQK